MFILQCLKSGLKGYASSKCIGSVCHEESTWFRGYTEKYYLDKGALYRAMYGKWMKLIVLLIELKHMRRKESFTFSKRYNLYMNGAKEFDRRALT